VHKLRDLQDCLSAESGKSIPEDTAELVCGYLEQLIQQIQAEGDVCSEP